MPEMKNNFQGGKMNKDLDERLVPNNEYRHALNVEIATSNDSDLGTLQTLKGNIALPGQNSQGVCIGSIADDKNDKLYFMVAGPARDTITEYDQVTNTFFPVCVDFHNGGSQRALNFNANFLITGINIIEDLLFWTDNNSEPKKISITKGKLGATLVLGVPSFTISTNLMIRDTSASALPNSYVAALNQNGVNISIEEKHLTVIKKGPPTAPVLEMIDTKIGDLDADSLQGGGELTRPLAGTIGSFLDLDGVMIEDVIPITTESAGYTTGPDWVVGNYLKIYKNTDRSIGVRVEIAAIISANSFSVKVLSGNIEIDGVAAEELIAELEQVDSIFQFKFPRFACRYKYEDGEYSAFSPFTQPAFIPGRFNYLPKEGYNLGMVNRLRKLVIKDFVHDRLIGKDVVSIDILYKDSNSTSIYSVKTIKKRDFDPTKWDEWNGITATTGSNSTMDTANTYGMDGWRNRVKGYLPITTEMIRAVLPANQLLRPWDNVPRKALAQEVIGNRLIYGNYLQNYNLENLSTNDANIKIDISFGTSSVSVGDTSPEEVHAGLGLAEKYSPAKSIKSLRTYQLGVVYIDRYGRETPVFSEAGDSSSKTSVYVPGTVADQKTNLNVQLKNNPPDWATHYKYFIKETSNEYYNLAMDRWYNAEDGNVWLSFPSAERNKVDEETFLILKKEHDNNTFVNEPARYKIIAIENEAPRFIKIVDVSMGGVLDNGDFDGSTTPLTIPFGATNDGGFPLVGGFKVTVAKAIFDDAGWGDNLMKQDISQVFFRVKSVLGVSNYYRLKQITYDSTTNVYVMLSGKQFGDDMSHTSPDNSHMNRNRGCEIQVVKKIPEDKAEFEGRFFVKILKDNTLIKRLHMVKPIDEGLISTMSLQVQYIAPYETIDPGTFKWDGYGTGSTTGHPEFGISIDKDNKSMWATPGTMSAGTHANGLKFWEKAGRSPDGATSSGSSGWFIDKVEAFRPFKKAHGSKKKDTTDWHRNAADINAFSSNNYHMFGLAHAYYLFKAQAAHKAKSLQVEPIHTYGPINYPTTNQLANTVEWLGQDHKPDYPINAAPAADGGHVSPSLGIQDHTTGLNIIHLSLAGLNGNTSDSTAPNPTTNADLNLQQQRHSDDLNFINKIRNAGTIWRWKEDPGQVLYVTVSTSAIPVNSTYNSDNKAKDSTNDLDGEKGTYLYNYGAISDYIIKNHHQWIIKYEGGASGNIIKTRSQWYHDWASRGIATYTSLRKNQYWSPPLGINPASNPALHWVVLNNPIASGSYFQESSIMQGGRSDSGALSWDANFSLGGGYSVDLGHWPQHHYFPTAAHDFNSAVNRRRRFTIHAKALIPNADASINGLGQTGPHYYLPTNDPNLDPHFKYNNSPSVNSDGDPVYPAGLGALSGTVITTPAPGIRPDGMFSGYTDPNSYEFDPDGSGVVTQTKIPTHKSWDANNINDPNGVPRVSNAPGTVTFEILEQFTADPDNFSSTNPAIWETEPKEDVGLDIYHEVGQIYPINLNNETIEQFVGAAHEETIKNSYVTCQDPTFTPRLIATAATPASADIRVVATQDNYVMLGSPSLSPTFPNVLDRNNGTHSLPSVGDYLRFRRADGSFTQARVGSNTYEPIFDPVGPVIFPGTWFELVGISGSGSNVHGHKTQLPWFNCYSFGNGVESDRIRDDFNQITIDNGPKASTTIEEPYLEERRTNGFIWSGLYNSTSGLNNLNQFIQAEKITKDVNPTYGSIQKMHARDSDLVAFCEDRVLKVLANKDALFNADGNTNLIATDRVLGSIKPFVGDFGISLNPESFASDSYRSYFTDTSRGAVIRLSQDGLTPISDSGMHDYFADSFSEIGGSSRIIGSFDDNKNEYNISWQTIKGLGGGKREDTTISYSEKSKGWVSFKSFLQENGVSLNNNYYTFSNGSMYQHHVNETRNNFYDTQFDSSVDVLFNKVPGIIKSFSTLNYEGSQARVTPEVNNNPDYYDNFPKDGWYIKEMISNAQELGEMEFWDKEDKWFSQIKGVKTEWLNDGTAGNIDPQEFSYQGIGNAYAVTCPTCPPVTTWDCVQNSCVQLNGPGGQFATEPACVAAGCAPIPQSYDCYNGVCSDDGTGHGAYATYCDCVNSSLCCDEGAALAYTCQSIPLPAPVIIGCMDDGVTTDPFVIQQRPNGWVGGATNYDANANVHDCSCHYLSTLETWDCVNGACIDPGTGLGQYASEANCYVWCFPESWDCISPGNCQDPGTGQGQYATKSACDTACPRPPISYDCDPTEGCIDPYTGNGQYTTLSACEGYGSDCCIPNLDMDQMCVYNFEQWGIQGSNVYSSTDLYYPGKIVSFVDPANGIVNYFIASAAGASNFNPPASSSNPQMYPQPIAANLWSAYNPTGYWEGCEVSGCNLSFDCTLTSTGGYCQDPGDGSGQYPDLASCQTGCVHPPSFNCINQVCEDPGDGSGIYASKDDCEDDGCIIPTWTCSDTYGISVISGNYAGQTIPPNTCVDLGLGTGQYLSLESCESSCGPQTLDWEMRTKGEWHDKETRFLQTFRRYSSEHAIRFVIPIICAGPSSMFNIQITDWWTSKFQTQNDHSGFDKRRELGIAISNVNYTSSSYDSYFGTALEVAEDMATNLNGTSSFMWDINNISATHLDGISADANGGSGGDNFTNRNFIGEWFAYTESNNAYLEFRVTCRGVEKFKYGSNDPAHLTSSGNGGPNTGLEDKTSNSGWDQRTFQWGGNRDSGSLAPAVRGKSSSGFPGMEHKWVNSPFPILPTSAALPGSGMNGSNPSINASGAHVSAGDYDYDLHIAPSFGIESPSLFVGNGNFFGNTSGPGDGRLTGISSADKLFLTEVYNRALTGTPNPVNGVVDNNNCLTQATWNCDAVIGCYDPGDGSGTYVNYASCISSCPI